MNISNLKNLLLWVVFSIALIVVSALAPSVLLLRYLLAATPVLFVLYLLIFRRWGVIQAGPAGWVIGLAITIMAFGLTPDVFWVSQVKGLLLSFYVILLIFPALFLYNVVNQAGGILAIIQGLREAITDRGMLLIVTAWAFSGTMEGLAGFGMPVAIVSPILAGMGVEPVIAIAAIAVGHAWAVTFGSVGIVFQTLVSVVKMDASQIGPISALMLGMACLACGFAASFILRQGNKWLRIAILGLVMAGVQYGMVIAGLPALGSLVAGLAGIAAGILLGRRWLSPESAQKARFVLTPQLRSALLTYAALMILMAFITLVQPVNSLLNRVVWQMSFQQVTTLTGQITPAGPGQAFRFLIHPGAAMLLIAGISYLASRRAGLCQPGAWRTAAQATWRSALPSSVGILSMVGLSYLMDHCGLTQLLAQALTQALGAAFPIVSPMVGILGAFATGSNNNSNVLFGPLQRDAAVLLNIDPRLLIATQTAGGALGSMLAPAKIAVGSSTLGLRGCDGDVLRRTVPYGLVIGLLIGLFAFILAR